jgi:hypothetical protein
MGNFLTDEVRFIYYEKDLSVTLDNQIYKYDNGLLEFAPKKLLTDDYSKPLTNKRTQNPAPAHFHDIKCRYKQRVVITLSHQELIDKGFLYEHYSSIKKKMITVCRDIPIEYLKIEEVTKWQTDCEFKEMMKALNINWFITHLYRAGVFFNVGWLWSGRTKIDLNSIYTDLI